MNSKLYPSTTHSLSLLNSPNKPLFSSLPSNTLFKFNTNHLNISTQQQHTINININITTKASATAHRSFTPTPTPTPDKETLYDLLGISDNVTLSEIKHAYKKMALKYHPDVSPPDRVDEYTDRFIKVQEAYETLSDPEARSIYDSCMAKGFVFSGKRETRFDPRSGDKERWKETWSGQISDLQKRNTRGMSWAARIRKQRNEACVNGSDRN